MWTSFSTKIYKADTQNGAFIPYKRDYLLFGPPGTGKSSFSLSLAGKHELDIYTLQLSNISDTMLMRLFAELPPRCIVLLEDVDTAGVGRRDSVDADQEKESKLAVTLSGLLNVLDGVSSQEGRILIMTTNYIEHLDEALIRPGRSDKKKFISNLPIRTFRLSSSTRFSSSCRTKSNATRNMMTRRSRGLLVILPARCPSKYSARQKFYHFFWSARCRHMMLFLVWRAGWGKQSIEKKEGREEVGGR